MPDVLLLCEYGTLGGGERSMLTTFDGVVQGGFCPAVACPNQGPLADALRSCDIEVVPWHTHGAAGSRLPQNSLRTQLAEILRHRRPALLHANSLSMGRLSGPVATKLRLPSIAHLRDILRLSRRAMADLAAHTRLLAVSEATRRFHVAEGLPAEKVYVLTNGVDLEQFRPRPATGFLHRQLGLLPESRLIGTIGQITLRKGQDVLVRAAAAIADQLPDVHYLIIGQRHSQKDESIAFEANLRMAAAHGPLAGRLHLLGHREDVPEILSELTLVVHPVRQDPLARVLLESAAAGVPIVATDVGGTVEVFPPQSNAARLVPPDDPSAMAEAILELLGDEPSRRRLAKATRCRAETTFDTHKAATALLRHYQEMTS